MCQKIIKSHKDIQLEYFEDKLKSKTTVTLIRFLLKKRNYKIFFIIGSDNLINFHKWDKYKELL